MEQILSEYSGFDGVINSKFEQCVESFFHAACPAFPVITESEEKDADRFHQVVH